MRMSFFGVRQRSKQQLSLWLIALLFVQLFCLCCADFDTSTDASTHDVHGLPSAAASSLLSSLESRRQTEGTDLGLIPTPRCRAADEAVVFRRNAGSTDPDSDCCDSYQVQGADTGCHHHLYSREEALNCLRGQHIFLIGGSLTQGLGMNLFTLLNPSVYPTDPDTYMNCTELYSGDACGIATHKYGDVSMADLVIDEFGDITSMLSVRASTFESSTGEFEADNAAIFVGDRMANVAPPGPNGIRITFVRIRYWDAVFNILENVQATVVPNLPSVVIIGIRWWWYSWCQSDSSSYCPRTGSLRNLNKAQMEARGKADYDEFLDNIAAPGPVSESLTRVLVTSDKSFGVYTSTLTAGVDEYNNEATRPFILEILNDETVFSGGATYSNLYHDGHLTNKANQMLVARVLNVLCVSAGPEGDVAEGEIVYFTGLGCTAEPQIEWTTSYAQHAYQTCTWTAQRQLPAGVIFTESPTSTPIASPTSMPTSTPTTATPTSTPTITPTLEPTLITAAPTTTTPYPTTTTPYPTKKPTVSPTTEPTGVPTLSPTSLPTGSPTSVPTALPTALPTVITPAPSDAPTVTLRLESEVFGLLNWVDGTGEVNVNGAGVEVFVEENWVFFSDATSGMSDDWFRIIISIVSGFILFIWGLSFLAPERYEKLLWRTGITSSLAFLDNLIVKLLEKITGLPMQKPGPKLEEKQQKRPHNSIAKHQDRDSNNNVSAINHTTTDSGRHARTDSGRMFSLVPVASWGGDAVLPDVVLPSFVASDSDGNIPVAPVLVVPVVKKKQKLRLSQLDVARFIASVHIVIGHLDSRGDGLVDSWNSHGFGFTWVGWFMMLSGFVLSLARLHSSNPLKLEPWYIFTAKRVKGIYPLYLTALVTRGVMISYARAQTLSLGSPEETFLSLFLLQSWLPMFTETVLQSHCWFLSAIVPYWCIHNFAYRKSKEFSTKVLWALLICAWAVPWILLEAVPAAMGSNVTWFSGHKWEQWGMPVDTGAIMLKFHPFAYLHIYLAGMVCAHLVTRRWEDPPLFMKWGCVIGYFGLYLIFSVAPYYHYEGSKLTFRLGTLVPLHAMLLFGLAIGADPLARLLSHPNLAPLGDISYAQYVFQFIVLDLWGSSAKAGVGFWLVLAAVSLCADKCVRDPIKRWKVPARKLYFYAFCSAIITPLVLVGLLALRIGSPASTETVNLPSAVRYSNTASDMRIELGDMELNLSPLAGRFSKRQYALINPSLVWLGADGDENNKDTFLFTARRHHIERTSEEGSYYTSLPEAEPFGGIALYNETVTWYSDIVVAKVHLGGGNTTMDVVKVSSLDVESDTQNDNYCSSTSVFSTVNQTLSTLSRFGPEDPRIAFKGGGSELMVTFNRVPNSVECGVENRMYVAPMRMGDTLDKTNTDTYISTDASLLEYTDSQDGTKEKNWMFINDEYFIRSLHPFSLCKWDETTNTVDELFRYNDELLAAAVEADPSLEIHGGANAVYVNFPNITGHLKPFYLSTLHTKNGTGEYTNYLVEFEATLPFRISRVSRALPLLRAPVWDSSVGAPMAFASGLAVVELETKDSPSGSHQVLVSYGSSNAESRVLRLGAYDVEELFGN